MNLFGLTFLITKEIPLIFIIEQYKYLKFDDNKKYTILCVYDFHENLHDPSLNHFKGIFYLNSKFYLVDDLEDEYHELKEDFIVNVSCLIYLKS